MRSAAPESTSSTRASSPRAATGRSTSRRVSAATNRPGTPARLGELLLGSTDWVEFRDFYLAVLQNGTLFEQSGAAQHVPEGAEETTQSVEDWVAAEPVHYRGQAALEREIAVMKASLGDTPVSDAFLTTTAPLERRAGS